MSLAPVSDGLASEWDALALATGCSPFLRRGWMRAWAGAFARGPLHAAVARRGLRSWPCSPCWGERRPRRRLEIAHQCRDALLGGRGARRAGGGGAGLRAPPGVKRLSLDFVAGRDPLMVSLEAGAPPGFLVAQRTIRRSPWLSTEAADYDAYERATFSGGGGGGGASPSAAWPRRGR